MTKPSSSRPLSRHIEGQEAFCRLLCKHTCTLDAGEAEPEPSHPTASARLLEKALKYIVIKGLSSMKHLRRLYPNRRIQWVGQGGGGCDPNADMHRMGSGCVRLAWGSCPHPHSPRPPWILLPLFFFLPSPSCSDNRGTSCRIRGPCCHL